MKGRCPRNSGKQYKRCCGDSQNRKLCTAAKPLPCKINYLVRPDNRITSGYCVFFTGDDFANSDGTLRRQGVLSFISRG